MRGWDSVRVVEVVRGRFSLAALLVSTGCATVGGAGVEPVSPHAESLPVKSVRLYETGVGYFEREGVLSPGTDSIALPASHVDDALKTLLVLSKGAVRVSGVEFESVLSQGLARAQAGLPPGQGRLTYPVVLESLRGVEVEVTPKQGEKLLGRLVDVTELVAPASSARPQPGTQPDADSGVEVTPEGADGAPDESAPKRAAPLSRYAITVVTPKGEVVRLDSQQIASLRPADPALAARLLSAIGTASERSAQAQRVLRISASGEAPVRIGYIAETPVWRVTYRLLLGMAGEPATLQGWVLVHNDTDEGWNRTELEIVNGRPDSFLLPLTAPRYLRRPLATPEEMSTLPQLATKTADQLWGDRDNPGEEEFGSGGLGLSGLGEGGGGTGQGFGAGHGRLGGSSQTTTSGKITVGDLAAITGSQAEESGARFHYRMAEPVTLGAHSSALVPFTQVVLKTLPVTRFGTDPEQEGRTAVQVTNTSKQTLPAGPLAVYESGGFVGEAVIARLVPGQDAWVSFGVDLDVEVERRPVAIDTSTIELVEYDARVLSQHYLRHRERPLVLANKSSLPRTVCVEVDVVNNATVSGADRLLYDQGTGSTLAVFELAPRSRLERRLITDEGLTRSTRLEHLQESYLAELAALPSLPQATRAALLEAQNFLVRQGVPEREQKQKAERLRQIDRESERLEKTIEKLNGADAAEPLVKRVVELERLRNQLEEEQQRLEAKEAERLPALSAILERLAAAAPAK